MDQRKIKEILNRYCDGESSEEEKAWVESWYNQVIPPRSPHLEEKITIADLEYIYKKLPKKASAINLYSIVRAAVACVAVTVFYFGLNWYFSNYAENSEPIVRQPAALSDDIPPGGNYAILKLADGATVVLNETQEGQIAEQNGINIVKNGDGLLTYTIVDDIDDRGEVKFNTISTPVGGQYQIILPDFTKVWINAASSLTFPVRFSGNERQVWLTGEGYFEVVENEKVPFKVITEDQEVVVLGTRFNINSYSNEPFTKTTLLQGSVKIVDRVSENFAILTPNEQARLADGKLTVVEVNTANEVVWKSGMFQLNDSDIGSLMRELSRWYGVEVRFEGEQIPDIKLWGEVYRNLSASEALEILAYFNLKFRIEENNGTKEIVIY